MSKKTRTRSLAIFALILAVLIAGIAITGGHHAGDESIQETMRDAVLHESNRIAFLGLEINPGLVAGFTVTAIITILALIIRIFFVPRFTPVPGRIQLLLEQAVGLFDGMAKGNSHHRNSFLGAYIFAAGCYIFIGTLFELLGLQMTTAHGTSIALPAPLSDINGAIMMGCLSYLVIVSGGIAEHGLKGIGRALKEFSLPISMSFRLFGALLSGALVTELVYYYNALSYGVPVVVGVLFTLLHAVIQAYVLTTLTSLYYGEVSEPAKPKEKKAKKKAALTAADEA